MIEKPPQNKMMTGAPAEKAAEIEKQGFHFSGYGVWHNMHVLAVNLEEATKQWLEKRTEIYPQILHTTPPAEVAAPVE